MATNIMNKLKNDETESDNDSKSSKGFKKKGGYLPWYEKNGSTSLKILILLILW